jgi:hypothetical protein
MTELEQATSEPEKQYSKTGLVIFGILQVILGVFCLLAVVGMIAAQFVEPPNPDSPAAKMDFKFMVPGLVIYIGAAVWFVWMGIGSIKARRWARDLTVVVSIVWLLTGIGSLFAMFFFIPDMSGQTINGEPITPRMASTMKNVMFGIVLFIMIIVPSVLLAYYSRKHVKETVMHLDPKERWTGRAPLPVMILIIFCLWAIISIVNAGAIGWLLPFFGKVIKGLPGAALAIMSGLLTLYAVPKLYKLISSGWWIVMALFVFWVVSMIGTIANVGLAEYFAMIDMPGMPADQVSMMNKTISNNELVISIQFMVTAVLFLGYLIYTKRYFPRHN